MNFVCIMLDPFVINVSDTELGASAGVAPVTDKRDVVLDLKKHENMVEQFFTLIRGELVVTL